jgi:hypothetical protein
LRLRFFKLLGKTSAYVETTVSLTSLPRSN